jgi:hypothetical protein
MWQLVLAGMVTWEALEGYEVEDFLKLYALWRMQQDIEDAMNKKAAEEAERA